MKGQEKEQLIDSIVIGTAGHIDHGKTTLVKALTGFDADTLAEEKKRGITINLGYAYCPLPSGKTAGFVDVPGHERFIKNMLAGAAGIDLAMVIIALDEGVMPQTKEHIEILHFLGVTEAVVVFTKRDLVDDELYELVREDSQAYLAETFLAEAPQVVVDAVSGRGIPELIALIEELGSRARRRRTDEAVRLPVDRVFTVKGYGTVVTGTLISGSVKLGDELVLYPGEQRVKVRGIQVHEAPVENASAGQRTALNLSGVTKDELHRGTIVATPELFTSSSQLEVKLTLSVEAKHPLKRMAQVKAYLGTAEIVAKVVPLDRKVIEPGETCYARLILREPVIARRGDRFVLRSISPVATIGGGLVLNPLGDSRGKSSPEHLAALKLKDDGTDGEVLESFVRENPFAQAVKLSAIAGVEDAAAALTELVTAGNIVSFGDVLVHRDYLASLAARAQELLAAYGERYPLREGMPKAELQERLGFSEEERNFGYVLTWLIDEDVVKQVNEAISLRNFQAGYTAEQEQFKDELIAKVTASGFTALDTREIIGDDPQQKMVLEALLKMELITLADRRVLGRGAYEKAKIIAADLFAADGKITVAAFRDALGTGRKQALALLERMDKERFTVRRGEERVLG